MNGHRHSILNDRDTPVARHFNESHHSIHDLHIIAIDHLPNVDTFARLNKETFWIHKLQTYEPYGINVKEQLTFPITFKLSTEGT